MKKISSLTNPEVKVIVQLHARKGRKEQSCFIAQGIRVIQTMIELGSIPIKLYVTELVLDILPPELKRQTITLVSDAVMNKISTSSTPSGVVALFSIPEQPPLDQLSSGLIAFQISDPGNLGTLLRTTAAMNKQTVVCIETVDPYNPKVVQASAGTLAALKIFQLNWDELIEAKGSLSICALVISQGLSPDKINFSDTLIMVGSEAHGIPEDIIAQCDIQCTLPMPGNIQSLNAAVAGSIALYLAWQD